MGFVEAGDDARHCVRLGRGREQRTIADVISALFFRGNRLLDGMGGPPDNNWAAGYPARISDTAQNKLRVYIPATVPMLRELVANREIRPVGGTAFAVTPTLRE